ncbi:MAG: PAS domain S-box protein [Thermodesulfobacteriota bacterium]
MEHATKLNTDRALLKVIGAHILRPLVRGLADLTKGSVSVFEIDGGCAATRTVSPWCKLLQSASLALTGTKSRGEAMASRKWHWHESSWHNAARLAIETGSTLASTCRGGLDVYAVPILARSEPVGALTFSYGKPSLDASRLQEIATLYGLDLGVLRKKACLHQTPSEDFLKAAAILAETMSALMGEIYARITTGEKIQETLHCLRNVLENVSTCTRVIDRDRKIVDLLGCAGIEKKGYTPDLLNEFCYAVSHHRSSPCTLEKIQCPLEKIIKTRRPVKIEHLHKDRQGKDIIVEIQAFPIFGPEKQVEKIIAVEKDISAQKQVAEALKRSKQQLAAIIDSVADHISMIDEDYNIVWVNDVVKRVFGPRLVGKKCYAAYHGYNSPCQSCGANKCFQDGKVHEHEAEVMGASGEKRILWCIANVATRYEDGRPKTVVEIARDITQRKQTEEALRNTEQLYRKEYRQTLRLKERLEEMAHHLMTAQEEERKKLSMELHDSISQDLTATRMMLEQTLMEYKKEGKIKPVQLEDSLRQLEHTIEELRNIISGLRPPSLDDLGLISTLRLAAQQFSTRFGIKVIRNLDVSEHQIPEQYKINIYRIVQEALHNVAKYAQATEVRLSLTAGVSRLVLVIADDGLGFDVEKVLRKPVRKRGFGLASIRERAAMTGGTCSFESRPGQGTIIRIQFPIKLISAHPETTKSPHTPL